MLKDSCCTAVHQFIVDDCICSRSALNLPSFYFVLRYCSMYQKISDRLGPRWCHHDYHHGYCHLLWLFGLRCCRLGGGGVSCFLHNYLSPRANDSSPWFLIGSPWCGRSLL